MKSHTTSTKSGDIKRNWHLIDLKNQILGRAATKIANLLMGKSKPLFVHYLDCGDYVIVINTLQVKVTGKKADQKLYSHYSGYPGGLKNKPYKQVMIEDPAKIIRQAVFGMLPKNKLRDSMLKRLYIYTDDKHPYEDKLKVKN